MAENSAIEWTHHTFNPWIGCTKISPACDNCYAESFVRNRMGKPELWQGERHRTAESTWKQPLAWNRKAEREGVRKRVFCASLADVFDNQVPAEWRADLWELIAQTPALDWLLLTKRPQNILKMLPPLVSRSPSHTATRTPWPWSNVWLGTTVENQTEADRRIPYLLSVPARVHFLSCEPLLGPVILPDEFLDPDFSEIGMTSLRWVIAGGESGPGARPTHIEWFRGLRDQCEAAGVPFLFKQHGDWVTLRDQGPGFWPIDDGSCIRLTPRGERTEDGTAMQRVGKKFAGRLLDGVLHDGYPAQEEVPA